MTIAEECSLSSRSTETERVAGRSNRNPNSSVNGNIYAGPLTAFLWELAVTFGTVSLSCETKQGAVRRCLPSAFEPALEAVPCQRELLWTRDSGFPKPHRIVASGKELLTAASHRHGSEVRPGRKSKQAPPNQKQSQRAGKYLENTQDRINLALPDS